MLLALISPEHLVVFHPSVASIALWHSSMLCAFDLRNCCTVTMPWRKERMCALPLPGMLLLGTLAGGTLAANALGAATYPSNATSASRATIIVWK